MRLLGIITSFGSLFNLILNVPIYFLEFFLSKEERVKRKLKRTKEKSLNKIKPGDYVKVKGIATIRNNTIAAPLSKKKCIGYHILIGKDGLQDYDHDYIEERKIQKFYLANENRKVLVIPNRAKINLKKGYQKRSGTFKNARPEMKEFLEKHKTSSTTLGFNKSLDFNEGVIEDGQKITIVGKVGTIKTRDNKQEIVIRNFEKHPLFIQNY